MYKVKPRSQSLYGMLIPTAHNAYTLDHQCYPLYRWTDAMSPWTLAYKEPALEATFLQRPFPDAYAQLLVIGSPVVALIGVLLSIREFWPDFVQPTPAGLWRLPYIFCFTVTLVLLRISPILLGIRSRSTANRFTVRSYYLCAMFLRLVALLYLVNGVIFLSLHCQVVVCSHHDMFVRCTKHILC